MTDIQPPPPPESRPPFQLDYENPDLKRPLGGVPYLAQMLLGFLAAMILVVLTVLLILIAINGEAGMFGLGVLMILGLVCFAMGPIRQEWHWPGFLPGVLTAVGLVLLVFGLCVAAMR
jgi:hypothetical protein